VHAMDYAGTMHACMACTRQDRTKTVDLRRVVATGDSASESESESESETHE